MSQHGHSALAARINKRNERTNAAARTGVAPVQRDYLAQPIRSAAEAKTWLEAHAGAEIGDLNARWNIRWVDPNLGPSKLGDGGARHIWLDPQHGAKSQIIELAKATQTYLRDHPAGTPGGYHATHEGLRRAVVANAQTLEHAAKADGRAADARAAHWLVESARHNKDLSAPGGTRFFAQGYEEARSGAHHATETLDDLIARYRDQLHAMDLWKAENINPQAHLSPGAERYFNNERAKGVALLHETENHARDRADSLKQLHEMLAHDQPAWASVKTGTDRDLSFDGQAKLLKQFDRGDYGMPKPTRAPKNETPEQRFQRIGRDVEAAHEWYGAARSRPRTETNRGRDRAAPEQMTRQEAHAYRKAYSQLEGEYNGLRVLREHNALKAAAEASVNDPFVNALKAGKAVVVRDSDGQTYLYDAQSYDPHHLPTEGGTIYYRHDTGAEAIKPSGNARYGPYIAHATVGALNQGRYNGATDRHEGPAGRTILGVFDSRAKAVNYIKGQPEYLSKRFEDARAHYSYVSRNYEEDKRRLEQDLAQYPSYKDSLGHRSSLHRLEMDGKEVGRARRSVASLERKMEQAGLRPKMPRARKAG